MFNDVHSFINEINKKRRAQEAQDAEKKSVKKESKEKPVKKISKSKPKSESIFVLANLEKLAQENGEGYTKGIVGAIEMIRNNGKIDPDTDAFLKDLENAAKQNYKKAGKSKKS